MKVVIFERKYDWAIGQFENAADVLASEMTLKSAKYTAKKNGWIVIAVWSLP